MDCLKNMHQNPEEQARVKINRQLEESGWIMPMIPEDYHYITGIFRNLQGIFRKEVAITIRH